MVNKSLKHAAATILSVASLSATAWGTSVIDESYITRGFFEFPSDNINGLSMSGDVCPLFAFSNNAEYWIRMTRITGDGQLAVGQELTSDSAASTEFGRTVELFGSSQAGYQLLVGDNNLAYYYTGGDWNTWSVQQVFETPDAYPAGYFGKNVFLNHLNNREFISACPSCGANLVGNIYVYEKDGPKNTWTQSALLEAAQLGPFASCVDSTVFLGDGNARISGDNILATSDITRCTQGGVVLFSKRRGQWSQQQTFWSALNVYQTFAVEDDTIAIGAPGASYGVTTEVGAVYVQYPNTPEFGVKPQPGTATQWSLHQILYPPDEPEGSFFGSDITIKDNRLYVGAPGNTASNTKIYLYERPSLGGFWSLQQSLAPPSGLRAMSTHDSTSGLIVALAANSDPRTGAVLYENKNEWECLIISLEDQFGDGWDTARLQISSPGADPVYFSPHCNAPNPFEFRYCPRAATPEYQGVHKIAVVDGPKSKFFWEIQWRVYEESTGDWYRGNHATRMDFHFDAADRKMTRRGIFHDLPTNITCITCPAKPEEKPKPRALKSETHAPTVSPAPTLGQTVMTGDAWRYLILRTTGEPWFDEQHQGTNYYISDSQGHRLISTGTSCLDTPGLCYQVIPDGQYVLRVSGGLSKFAGDHEWEFCGRRGKAEEQLNFIIKDSKCDAVLSFTSGTYCSTVLHSSVVTSIELEIFGVSETTTLEQLSAADFEALSSALSQLVGHGLSPSDVKLSAITNQFGHAIFDVTIYADAAKFGADPHDLDSMENVVTQLGSIFSNAATSGQLLTCLTSTTIPGATFLQNLQAVQFISASLNSVEPHAETESAPSVTNIAPPETASEPVESNDNLFYFVIAGYVACVVALIGLVAYAYKQIGSTQVAVSVPVSVPTNEIKSEPTQPVSSAAAPGKSTIPKTRKQQPKSVDSTQKSQQMNTIMIADLIQMVKEEDEQLQQTMSSDHFRV